MNRNQYLPATRTWVTMLFMAWWVFIAGVSISCAEQPAKLSDEDVIEKSAAAMRPPIQYRMRVANLETTVSQQILANGVLATRTEAVTPGQTIVLCLGGRYFDILPYSEVVIDKTQIEVRPMTAAFVRTNDLLLSLVPEVPDGVKIIARNVKSVVIDERPCYEIETKFSFPEMGDTSLLSRILGAAVPRAHVLTVDAATCDPIDLRCVSSTGSLIQKYEYVDIQRSADTPDSLFELPATYNRVTPTSMNEYFDYQRAFWTDIKPRPAWTPRYPTLRVAPRFESKIDPKRGTITPIPTTPEQAKVYADYSKRQEVYRTKPASNGRRAFLIANVVAILAWLSYVVVRRLIRLKQ